MPHIGHKGSISTCVFSWAQPLCRSPCQAGRAAESPLSALAPGGMGQDGAAGLSKITQKLIKTQTTSAVIRSVHCVVLHATSNRPFDPAPSIGLYTLLHLWHHFLSDLLGLPVCLLVWYFSPPPHSPTMALAIHLQTSKYRLGTGTESEPWHLINKVSLNRQNSLMKMTLKKDVCSYCHRGLRP